MNLDPRNHTMSLEDVQRLSLGLEDGLYAAEPMNFSAETIADMLEAIGTQVSEWKAAQIHAVVRALRGEDQNHRLELRQLKKGRHKLEHVRAAERKRNKEWLEILARFEDEGIKTESAIAAIADKFKVSRASVFSGIKRAEHLLELGRSIEKFQGKISDKHENPRPSKRGID